mmetsp:Transcript_9800/g.12245  ORF Transcript_9800/g.12245 Transcript_9800/m.12245 type:complete len:768 (+) Transcript_9800:67-2370(+)
MLSAHSNKRNTAIKIAAAGGAAIGGYFVSRFLWKKYQTAKLESKGFGNFDYPITRKCDHTEELHGVEVADPYRWLEDPDSPEVMRWVERQNACSSKYFSSIGDDMDKFKDRLSKLFSYDKYGCPSQYGDYIIFQKKEGLQNQFVVYKQRKGTSDPEVLLDPNTLREDGTAALKTWAFTEDGTKMAYGISYSGSDWFTIYVKDVVSGQNYADEINWCKFSGISWTKDGSGFFYAKYPAPSSSGKNDGAGTETEAAAGQKVYYHKLGTSQDQDQLLFSSPENPKWLYGVEVTDDGAYLLVTVSESCDPVNRLFLYDLSNFDGNDVTTMGEIIKVVDNFDSQYSYITNEGRSFWFHTNKDAPKYKIGKMTLPEEDLSLLSPEALQSIEMEDVVAEEANVLEGAVASGGTRILLLYLRDVKNQIDIVDFNGQNRHQLELPGVGSIGGFSAKKKDKEFFFQFTAFQDPGTNIKVTFSGDGTGSYEQKVYHKIEVPGLDSSEFVTDQIFYHSKDNTRIPMFIIKHKDAPAGPAPCLLYGYGGFNISITPYFGLSRLLFAKHFGGTVAIANIRGGGEYGEDWHKAGTIHNKQNVFDDFIAAAQYLQNSGVTSPQQLAIQGGSNGGLLVGACINQQPQLFAAALAQVGVMDMLRFHKFTIGYAWCSDYGNPDDEAHFKTLYGYSPIHNVDGSKRYPATLLTTGDHDDRVVPLHSYKYIAAIQDKVGVRSDQDKPLIIKIDTKSGHGAGKPTSKVIEETSELYAFIAKNTGAVWKD